MSALGSIRGAYNDLSMPPGMVAEDDEYDSDNQDSIDTGAATKGSDPIPNGIGMNHDASHSTVIIKPPRLPDSATEETPPGKEHDSR